MVFLVQHRAPNGSVVDLKITAKNREECFTFLTEKGIVAISVSELKNAKKSSYNTASRYLGIIKYVLFFIGALCIPLAFLIFSKTPKNQVGIDRELKRKNIKITQNAHVKHMRPNSIVSNQSDAAFVNISTNNYRSSRYPSRHPPNHPAVTNVRKKAIFKTS